MNTTRIPIPSDFVSRYIELKLQGRIDEWICWNAFYVSYNTLQKWKREHGIKMKRASKGSHKYVPVVTK